MEIKIVIDETRIGRALKSRRFRFGLLVTLILAPMVAYAATLAKPYTFKDGDTISAAQVNDNFDKLYNAVNTMNAPRFPGSKIVSDEQGDMVSDWVGSTQRTWTLCYRRSDHGAASSTFHTRCNGKGDTITIAKLDNGRIIGGYAACSWVSASSYIYQCAGSFLFSVSSMHKYNKHFYSNTYSSSFSYLYWLYDNTSYGPTWGGGHDLYIASDMTTGYCNLGHDYTCRVSDTSQGGYGTTACQNEFCGSYNSWKITELEVWYYNG